MDNKLNNNFYDEDEIDLLEVIKPLVKYKLQFIIILVLGLTSFFVIQMNIQQENIQQKNIQQKNTIEYKQELVARIITASKTNSIFSSYIKNFEFVYKDLKTEKVKSIILILEDRYLPNNKYLQENYSNRLFVNLNQTTTDKLHQALSSSLNKILKIDKEIVTLEFDKNIHIINSKLKKEFQRTANKNKAIKTNNEVKNYLPILNNYQFQKHELMLEIHNLIRNISSPVFAEASSTRIPWNLYRVISQNRPKDRLNIASINKDLEKLSSNKFNHEILKDKLINYLDQNKLNKEASSLELPIIKEISAKPVHIETKVSLIQDKKKLTLGIIVILIFAIISVYIRVFIEYLIKSDKTSERWTEFFKALKYWKL